MQVYTKNDSIYPYFEKEFTKLKQRFAAVQSETAHSKLYAARFREMNDFLMGVGSRLDLSEAERNLEFREFMRTKVNMEELYTSNLWSSVISNWFTMHQSTVKNDKLLLEDAKVIFDRITSKQVYTAFADKLVVLLSKAGKDELVSSIGT